MDRGRFSPSSPTRRDMLLRCANGFGAVALAALLSEESRAGSGASAPSPHFAPRARNVIFLYMDGGPSQVDTFDYKPILETYHGRDPNSLFKVEPTQFNNVGKVMASPWRFRRRGASGLWVSDLFPEMARCADDLCVIRSMVAKFPEHTNANFFLHTGVGSQGRPSMGAWASYGLGTGNANLPGFIVLNGGLIPVGGPDNFHSGFLPAAHQASIFRPADPPVSDIRRLEPTDARQRSKLDLVGALDRARADRVGHVEAIDSAIANYETAYRMQAAVPELMEIRGESARTRALYGLDAAYGPTRTFAAQCLIARRLVERGVRFVELTCPDLGIDRWDQHKLLRERHEQNARVVDRPIAGLLRDLKSRGLLATTLVVWAGEFGRTPFAQGADGRDHNPFGFSIWMAGAGVKTGVVHGETDEWGYKVVKDRVEIHDFHATMLHLLGLDHKRLTFRAGGGDLRLTDVAGEVVKEILA